MGKTRNRRPITDAEVENEIEALRCGQIVAENIKMQQEQCTDDVIN